MTTTKPRCHSENGLCFSMRTQALQRLKWSAALLVTLFVAPDPRLACEQTNPHTNARRAVVPSSHRNQSGNLTFKEIAQRAAEAREGNRIDEGIALYRQGVAKRPSWAEGWWYLGTLLYEADRYAEARDAFRQLVSIQPERGGAPWALLGLCEFQLRDYEPALRDLQRGRFRGLGENKELTRVTRYHVAILLTRFEQFEAALQLLFAMVHDEGNTPTLRAALGIAALGLPFLPSEVPPEKREVIQKAGKAAYFEAMALRSEARREFEDLVTQFPTTPNVHYFRGVFLIKQDAEAAMREFRREIEVSPEHVRARLQIAFEYIKRGDFMAGLPYAEKAVGLAPNSFAAHNALGRIMLEAGDVPRATKELEEAVRLAPDSPECRYALSRAYGRAGRKQDADRERAEFARLKKLQREVLYPQSNATSEPQSDERPPI